VLDRIGEAPRAYVLDLEGVPLIDSTAVAMLEAFVAKASAHGVEVVFAAPTPAVRKALSHAGAAAPKARFSESVEAAMRAPS
jgi:SulP family sulfate permease